jgi:long-chain acyl-CoA synthetase
MIVGEGREFLTALVVPNVDALKSHARANNITSISDEDLLEQEAIRELFGKEFRSYSRTAAAHEKIRDFRLLAEPFTVENGMMTPTLKPKRRAIETHYADVIEGMYAEVV